MFALPLIIIGRLDGVGVADELRVEIQRVIWLPQRKAEVVNGKDIFQQFRLRKVTNATCLPGRVERVGQRIGARVEVVVIG